MISAPRKDALDPERIAWIDTLKALGIFLVVFAHHKTDPSVVQFIYAFHMPLFFLISGFLFDPRKYASFREFAGKRLRTLIVPYFFFAVISYLFWLIAVRSLSVTGRALEIPPLDPLVGIFYSAGVQGWKVLMATQVWFLTCLFVVEILFWGIQKRCGSHKGKMIAALLISGILGFVSSRGLPFRLPWSAEAALIVVVFYGAGFIFKGAIVRSVALAVWKKGMVALGVLLGAWFFCSLNGKIDIYNNIYHDPLLFYAAAFLGIYGTMLVSQMIPANEALSFIGRNTLIIMGMEKIALFLLRGMVYLVSKELPYLEPVSLGGALIWSLGQIVVLVPVIWGLNRYLPFFVGRRGSFRRGSVGVRP